MPSLDVLSTTADSHIYLNLSFETVVAAVDSTHSSCFQKRPPSSAAQADSAAAVVRMWC